MSSAAGSPDASAPAGRRAGIVRGHVLRGRIARIRTWGIAAAILLQAAALVPGCTSQGLPTNTSGTPGDESPAVKRDPRPIVIAAMPPEPPLPPPGIPAPPFGITESHSMYADRTFDFGRGPEPYNDAGNGPYTHYVDNTSPAATDADNPFGTAATPRLTVPTNLPAGSVVEVHGGPYIAAETILVAQGTPDMPVFLRGINWPRFSGKLTFYSQAGTESRYAIIEGLSVFKFWVIAPASYLACRLNDIQGDYENGGVGIDTYDAAFSNHHLLFYRNAIHDNGDWQADYDQDVHGICVARYTDNVWILGNEMYRNSGDGLQINAGSAVLQPYTHHIYVGGNVSHHNKQAGLWCKQATDVIFSRNTCYALRPIGTRPSAYGAGMGFQYGPERVWFLYNDISDCSYGISSGSSNDGPGQDTYCIGNLIHDIRHDPGYPYNPGSSWSNAAISLVGTANRHIVGNTIWNCDAGINSPSAGRMVIVNNIIGRIVEPGGRHVHIEDSACAAASELTGNLFFQDAEPIRIRWGAVEESLAGLQAAGKGAGCLIADPLLADPGARDFRLQQASPAIDAGVASDAYQVFLDLYGLSIEVDAHAMPRPQGISWDIGACEYIPSP